MFFRVFYHKVLSTIPFFFSILLVIFHANAFNYGKYLVSQYAEYNLDYETAADSLRMMCDEGCCDQIILEKMIYLYLMNGDFDNVFQYVHVMLKDHNINNAQKHYLYFVLSLQGFRNPVSKDSSQYIHRSLEYCVDKRDISCFVAKLLLEWHEDVNMKAKTAKQIEEIFAVYGENSAIANYHIAMMHEFMGNNEEALRYYRKLLNNKISIRVVETIARFMVHAGYSDELDGFIEKMPYSIFGYDYLKSIPYKKITPHFAISELLIDAAALFKVGGFVHETAIYLQAARYVALDPSTALYLLGDLWQSLGIHGKANNFYAMLDKTSVHYNDAVVNRSYNEFYYGERSRAFKILNDAYEYNKKNALLVIIGDLHSADKQYQKSLHYYDQFLNFAHDGVSGDFLQTVYLFRAVSLNGMGRWRDALAELEYAMKYGNANPFVINYLAYNKIIQNEDVQEMVNMLSTVLLRMPNDPAILDSLGWGYYKLGQYDKAVTLLERAGVIMINDPVVNEHLGDAYWRAGRKLEAGFQWRKVIFLTGGPNWQSDDRSLVIYKNAI